MENEMMHCEVCGEDLTGDGQHTCIRSHWLPPDEVIEDTDEDIKEAQIKAQVEAKDTVLKKKWMSKEVTNNQNALLLEQAEISFKAGREEEHRVMIGVAVDEGNKAHVAGRKEVVDYLITPDNGLIIRINGDKWGKKLKEWSVKHKAI